MPKQGELYSYLKTFLSDNRSELFERVVANRTRHLTVVLEDIYQQHNANAVIRNCECFGIQDLHVIENENTFKGHRYVSSGAWKWIHVKHYNREKNNNRIAVKTLKESGYRVITTSPHSSKSIEDLDLSEPTALVFGNEKWGMSEDMLSLADDSVHIPMYGMTESLNLSVSVALGLQICISRLRQSETDWKLSEKEQDELLLEWTRKSVKHCDMIEKRYLADSE